MQKTIGSALMLLAVISCGETAEKKVEQNTDQTSPKKEESGKVLPSGDYSSLLLNYECDMDAAEVSRVLKIPETDVSIPEFTQAGNCSFEIKGFGENALGGTILSWGATPFSKADSKKEIQSALKDKEKNENIFGMDIELSETGDCYIRILPHVGRVIIYNENYDHAFFFTYSQRGIYKRTEEEHAALGAKTIVLANYLLKKHKR
tara:strand:- start:3728 stop:4342 length:615 start_codon:yes stop_codon:yes gene_type:complete